MPRKMRVQFSGAMYHVMSRGDQRDDIFFDDVDRHDFIKTLAEACQKTDWQVHAFCLMRNHYHLVVETPNANLVAGMQWLQSTYTIRLNNRHALTSHVLSGRYKAQLIEGGGNGYLRTACDYVHLNPIRAKLLAPETGFWLSRGAALASTWQPASIGPRGYAWIGCWASTAYRRTRRCRASNLSAIWRGGGWRRPTRRRWKPFAAIGVWAARPFARSSWSGWKTAWGRTTQGNCVSKPHKPRRIGL